MSVIDKHNEEIYEQVRAILSEHFQNFIFCVMDEEGNIYYDYTNVPIGKMLIREIKNEMLLDADDVLEWADWNLEEEEGDEWS